MVLLPFDLLRLVGCNIRKKCSKSRGEAERQYQRYTTFPLANKVLHHLHVPKIILIACMHNLIHICKELFASKQIICITVQTSGGKPAGGFNFQHEYLIFIVPNDFEPNALLYSGGNARTPFERLTLATFNKIQRPNQTYPLVSLKGKQIINAD